MAVGVSRVELISINPLIVVERALRMIPCSLASGKEGGFAGIAKASGVSVE